MGEFMLKISLLSYALLFLLGCNVSEPVQSTKSDNQLAYHFSIDYSWWVPFSYGDREIGVARLQGPVVIDNPGIYKWIGSYASGYWIYIGSGASRAAMEPNGNPVVTMPDGGAWRYKMATGTWESMNFGYLVREVGIAADGDLWVLSKQEYSPGTYWIGHRNTNGSFTWYGGGAKEIAVQSAVVWSPTEIYYYPWVIMSNGSLWTMYANNTWVQKPPTGAAVGTKATDVAASTSSIIYVVGDDFDAEGNARVWCVYGNGANWENFAGARGVRVAMGDDQDVFIIRADGTTVHHYVPH